MENTPTPAQQALDRAIDIAKGKTALMRLLNERGHEIGSHNTVSQWRENGVPEKYCPDIEDLTGVRCEDLCPRTNWTLIRGTGGGAEAADAGVTAEPAAQ